MLGEDFIKVCKKDNSYLPLKFGIDIACEGNSSASFVYFLSECYIFKEFFIFPTMKDGYLLNIFLKRSFK